MKRHGSQTPKPKRAYEVGYGRPPASGQFKKGAGRKPRRKPRDEEADILAMFKRIAAEMVNVHEGAVERRMTRAESVIMANYYKSQKRDQSAMNNMLLLAGRHGLLADRERDNACGTHGTKKDGNDRGMGGMAQGLRPVCRRTTRNV